MTKLGKIFLVFLIIALIAIALFLLINKAPKGEIEELTIKEENKIDDSFKPEADPLKFDFGFHICGPGGNDCILEEDYKKVIGNIDDLISFSIYPDSKVSGVLSYMGSISGGYFFEGNILINILDMKKNVLLKSNAMAKTDWMTEGPVKFDGSIDFTNLPKGPAYFEIRNDNLSGLREHDKSILIPIIIE